MKKRVFCLVLTLLIFFSLAPMSYAQTETAALSDGDYVYMGQYEGKPIKWRVLDADAMNTGADGAFLFSEYLIQKYGTAYAEAVAGWQGSMAQEWCTKFYANAFTAQEQAAIPAVSKDEEESQLYGLRWGTTQLIDENVFFISSMELAQYVGDKDGADGLSASTEDGIVGYWWLRTSHRNHPDYAGLVLEDNEVHDFLVYIEWGTRPAMNLDLEKVLCFAPAYEGAEGEWKPTVVDESMTLSVNKVMLEENKLKAEYSGAPDAEGNYISLLIRDSNGSPTASVRLGEANESGTVEIPADELDIPAGGSVWLYIEKDNGDYKTSLASTPCELACKVSFAAGEGDGVMEPIDVTPGVASALPECEFIAQEHRRFAYWEMDGKPLEDTLCITEDALLTAMYEDIPVSSISFESSEIELELFKKATVTATIEPLDAADRSLTWKSEHGSIATVKGDDDGSAVIEAKCPGTAVVTAYSRDGAASESITVTVTGSAYTAYAANYGIYAIGFAVAAMLIMLVFRPRKKTKQKEQNAKHAENEK